MRLLSLFSGIGAFEKALDRLDIDYELVNYCEIDPYASKAYPLIHNVPESKNLGDITKVDTSKLHDIDMITYGFPCVDISLAGRMRGFEHEGEQTRSGLFYEAMRIIEDTKPAYAICENVKNLVSKRFKDEFEIVLSSLEKAGYNNYWKVLNAKDFGIPQNRERVFIISIRKDIDDGKFQFPQPKPLELRLKDLLEDEVDDKYYLKKNLSFFIKNSFDMERKGNGFRFEPHIKDNAQIAKTITTKAGVRMDDNFVMDIDSESEKFKFDSTNPKVIQIGNVCPTKTRENPNQGRVYDENGLSPALTSMSGGNRQPMIVNEQSFVVRENNKRGFTEAYEGDTINCEQPNSKTRRGRVGRGVAQTINTGTLQGVVVNDSDNLRIRKLTPKECFRLMGFDDRDIDILVENKISNTQLYKMAGNSIVVSVLEGIFRMLSEEV